MKDVKKISYWIKFDGDKNWFHLKNIIGYEEDKPDEIIPCPTFKDFWEKASTWPCMYQDETFFRHRPRVNLIEGCDERYITEKNFKPVSLKISYKKVQCSMSLASMMDTLPAEDFLDYLKSKGITNLPIGLK